MITVTKERNRGGSNAGKFFYRARIGMNDLATGATKQEALTAAYQHIADVLSVNMCSVRVAVANDGTVITAREFQAGFVETQYHRTEGLPTYRTGGSSLGRMAVDCHPVNLREYLFHEVERYNEATGTVAA